MRNLTTLIIVLLLSFSFGCSKSQKTDSTDSKNTKKEEAKFVSGFACKIDGKDFLLTDPASYAKKDDKSFTIYAKIDVDGGQYDDFFIYVDAPLLTGDFALSKENKPGHAQYRTNKDQKVKTESDIYWSDAGKLTITKADDKEIIGTFNFTATGTVNDVEKKISITDGKIKLKIQ